MRRVLYALLGHEGLWLAISLVAYVFAVRSQPATQRESISWKHSGRGFPWPGFPSHYIPDGLFVAGWRWAVASASGGGFLRRRAGGFIHCGQQG